MFDIEDAPKAEKACVTHCAWVQKSELFAEYGCSRLVRGIFTRCFYALQTSHVAPLGLAQGVQLLFDTLVLAQKLAKGTSSVLKEKAHKHDASWFRKNVKFVQINITKLKVKKSWHKIAYAGYEHFHAFISCAEEVDLITKNDWQPEGPCGLFGGGTSCTAPLDPGSVIEAVLALWKKTDQDPKNYPAVYIAIPFIDGEPAKEVLMEV